MDATKTVITSLPSGIAALGETGNRVLREAIENNLVLFPAQVPTFKKVTRADLQAKIAMLYFVRGWSMSEIAERYRLSRRCVGQIVTQWRIRAVAEGYIRVIQAAPRTSVTNVKNRTHTVTAESHTAVTTQTEVKGGAAWKSTGYAVNAIPNDRKAFTIEAETPAEALLAAIEKGMLLDFSGYYGLAFAWKLGQVYRGALLRDQKLTEDHIFETAEQAIEWLQQTMPRLD